MRPRCPLGCFYSEDDGCVWGRWWRCLWQVCCLCQRFEEEEESPALIDSKRYKTLNMEPGDTRVIARLYRDSIDEELGELKDSLDKQLQLSEKASEHLYQARKYAHEHQGHQESEVASEGTEPQAGPSHRSLK